MFEFDTHLLRFESIKDDGCLRGRSSRRNFEGTHQSWVKRPLEHIILCHTMSLVCTYIRYI